MVPAVVPHLVGNTGLRALRAAIAEPDRYVCEPKVDGVRGLVVYGPGGTLETRNRNGIRRDWLRGREGDRWPMGWSEENQAAMEQAQTRVQVLRERIIDHRVRSQIEDATDQRSRLLMSSSSKEALDAFTGLVDAVEASIGAVGTAFRSISD